MNVQSTSKRMSEETKDWKLVECFCTRTKQGLVLSPCGKPVWNFRGKEVLGKYLVDELTLF